MSVHAGALTMGRRMAESMHTETFTVSRATGNKVTDPVTLEQTDELAVIHASVMGKYQFPDSRPRDVQVPGLKVAETAAEWHTSITVLGVLTDDIVECIAVGEGGDPELVGSRVRVVGPFLKSHATARRFPVEELS